MDCHGVGSELRATREMCLAAFQALEGALHGRPQALPTLPDAQAPLFVTWHTLSSRSSKPQNPEDQALRGCIGILKPIPLRQGIPKYACIAALEDTRFPPMTMEEFDEGRLMVDVSLLVNFQHCDPLDWQVGKHGITIVYQGRSSIFLPCVAEEQGWDQQETLLHLLHKGGSYVSKLTPAVLGDITCERFEASVAHLTFDEYRAMSGDKC